jgi:hypothetical protein
VRAQAVLKNWIDQGTLPALHVGRRVRVRRSDFEALLERGRTVRTGEPEQSAAQAFWEGELLPVPTVDAGGGE